MLWIKNLFFQRIPTETAGRVSPDGFDDPGFGVSGPGNLSFFGVVVALGQRPPVQPIKTCFFFWETWQPTKMPLGLGFFKGFCWQLYYLLSFCGEDELVDRLLFFFEVSLHPTGRCYVSSFWFWSFGCIEKSNLSNCLFWWFPITT